MLSMMIVRNFYVLRFARPDPQGQEITKYGGFQAILAQNGPGRGLKTEKHNFPALGVRKSKRKVTTLSGMFVRNFFTFYVLPEWTPTGGKSQNTDILGHFGLGQPLALEKKTGAGPKTEKCNFPVLRALLGGGIRTPQKFLPDRAQRFYFYVA